MNTRLVRLLSVVMAFAPALVSAVHIVIDPGHGGKDPGVVHGGVKESGLALAIAAKLEASLEAKGCHVTLTREDDSFVTTKHRALLIPDRKPAVVISLHLSESKDPAKRGFQIFTAKDSDATGLIFEERELPKRLAAALEKLDPQRPVKSGKLAKPYLGTSKALILELGYLSNDADRKLVQSAAYQQQVVDVIATTINDLH